MPRPDLDDLPPDVVAYIEALESALLSRDVRATVAEPLAAAPEPSEPETTVQVISISRSGLAKRTPRHFYSRQRRAGMGVFDLDSDEADPPAFVLLADLADQLLLFTNLGRVFPYDVEAIAAADVRGRGQSLLAGLTLRPAEQLAAVLPGGGGRQVVLASTRGWVRSVVGAFFGRSLIPGLVVHDPAEGGPLAAACWSNGDADLLLATRAGEGLRISERQVPGRRGRLGARVANDDAVVAVTAVAEDDGVLLVGADGRGTVRLMSGFRQTKTPGSGTKQVLKTERLVAARRVGEGNDVFLLSRLGKMIRFSAAEIPPKEGLVQGVNCMALRADEAVAAAVASLDAFEEAVWRGGGSRLRKTARRRYGASGGGAAR